MASEARSVTLVGGCYEATVDAADFELVSGLRWYAQKSYNTVYAINVRRIDGRSQSTLMHRLIMNAPAGMQVDHIDGNGLNNQRSNLRLCTASQNAMNRPKAIGVDWCKRTRRWRAHIRADGKTTTIGRFDSWHDAKVARDAAVTQHFGAFAPRGVR